MGMLKVMVVDIIIVMVMVVTRRWEAIIPCIHTQVIIIMGTCSLRVITILIMETVATMEGRSPLTAVIIMADPVVDILMEIK